MLTFEVGTKRLAVDKNFVLTLKKRLDKKRSELTVYVQLLILEHPTGVACYCNRVA